MRVQSTFSSGCQVPIIAGWAGTSSFSQAFDNGIHVFFATSVTIVQLFNPLE